MSDQFEQKPPINFEEENRTSPENESVKIWGGVTDPRKHDSKKFRYLVHAFNLFATSYQPLSTISAELSGAYQVDKSEGDQSINLFEQPERLGERVSLSMSLIDQDHTGTWGEGGIIVEAPEENIVITSPTDVGAGNSSKDYLKKQAQNQSRLSGDQLLQATSYDFYNEVVAFAKSENGKTLQLKGFFIKVNAQGEPTNPVIAEKMREHAKRLNLPLVEIPTHKSFDQERFEISGNNVWAHYRGIRYNLGSDNPEIAFSAYYDKFNAFFPSPQEIEEVIAYFVGRGNLNQAQAQQIRERYEIADSQRKSPKVEYDPKTKEISRVTIKDGYGKGAIEYWLSPSGDCGRVDMEKYTKYLQEKFLNPQKVESDPYGYLRYLNPLSGYEVLSILESRRETMAPEDYEKLIEFFRSIKDKIDQAYEQQQNIQKRRENRF